MFALRTFLLVLSLAIFRGAADEVRADAASDMLCPDAAEVLAASDKIDARPAFRDTANFQLNAQVLKLAECYDQTGDEFAAEVVGVSTADGVRVFKPLP